MNCLRLPSNARPVSEDASWRLSRKVAARRQWLMDWQRAAQEREIAYAARLQAARDEALRSWAKERPANVTNIEEARVR